MGNDFTIPQLKSKPTTVYLILPGRYMEGYARFLPPHHYDGN